MPTFRDRTVIDFGTTYDDIMSGSISLEKKKEIGKGIVESMEKNMYAYLTGFADFEDLINEFRRSGDEFLDLPLETKQKYPRNLKNFHGYNIHQSDETAAGCPKVHEAFDISEVDRMPKEAPIFAETTKKFMNFIMALGRVVYSAVELGLGYEKDFLNGKISYKNEIGHDIAQLRFVRYPPLDESFINTQRFLTHKDFGTFTFIFQDDVGGLEMRNREGEWIESNHQIPNSVVLIAGAQMPLLTDGRIEAAEHRVVSRKNLTKYRRSCIFFNSVDFPVLLKSPNQPTTDSTENGHDFFVKCAKEVYKTATDDDYESSTK